MKKLFIFYLLILSILFVAETQAQTILKMALSAPAPVYGPVAEKFGEILSQKTERQMQIKWFGQGQLGTNTQVFAQIKTGQIDMILLGSTILSLPKGGKDFNILNAPYVFQDQDHLKKYFFSPLFRKMIETGEKEGGFKFVGYLGDRAPRQLTTSKRKVTKLEDLKGLTLRVPENKSIVETWKAWGAVPVPVAASELYMALKQGIVEGQDNGFDSIAQVKFYEVQKFVMVIDYVRTGLVLLMSTENWNKLNPPQRKVLEETALETEKFGTKQLNDSVASSIETLKKNGMEIIIPDLGPFKKRAVEVNEKFEGDLWEKGLLQKIQAIK